MLCVLWQFRFVCGSARARVRVCVSVRERERERERESTDSGREDLSHQTNICKIHSEFLKNHLGSKLRSLFYLNSCFSIDK